MPSNEHHAADRRFSLLRVTGNDRIEFLQGQLTQDIANATPNQPMLAGWASPKGRLIALFWLLSEPDACLLICPSALAESVAARLKMFVLRSDVEISLAEASVEGRVIRSKSTEEDSVTYCFKDDNELIIGNTIGLRIGLTEGSAGPVSDAWRLAAIRLGVPVVWPENRESFVPQMVNLDLLGGISFSKGCYVGQEIVARTQNLGRIKRRMYRFEVSAAAAPQPGQPIYAEGKNTGQIIDASATEAGAEMLAVCRIESLGQSLALDEDGSLPLSRLALPYAIPEAV